jgi:hypothetical protein
MSRHKHQDNKQNFFVLIPDTKCLDTLYSIFYFYILINMN